MSYSTYRGLPAVFSLTLFTSAGLLFLIQPMIAKMILPLLGGAPSVWNTCMMFFQAMLLAGYGYAHYISTRHSLRSQMVLQAAIIILGFLLLPPVIRQQLIPSGGTSPAGGLLLVLLSSVGVPFFVLSSTAPLLQKWFAATSDASSKDPYFLYSASNLGSMMALISYPLLIEPGLAIAAQNRAWSAGYLALGVLTAVCAGLTWKYLSPAIASVGADTGKNTGLEKTEVSRNDRLRWVGLAFVPSSLMLGVTTFITTDIAAVPMFWVLPLSLYLLSFIIVFAVNLDKFRPSMYFLMLVSLTVVIAAMNIASVMGTWYVFAVHLVNLFIVSMVCHGELALKRPASSHLTEFYLLISFGGVLGGIFNALVAPLVFNSIVEYPLTLLLAALLLPAAGRCKDHLKRIVVAMIIVALFSEGLVFNKLNSTVLYQARTFFGVIKVRTHEDGNALELVHGITTHGMQNLDPRVRNEPTTYYLRQGAIGEFFSSFSRPDVSKKVAVLGLGIGTLAGYGEKGDVFDFFEIDPSVKRVATDPAYFTFLRDSKAKWKIIMGDARMEINKAPTHYYDIIILDAFAGDAVPVHLLTREALKLYLLKLQENGLILVNITNRHLNLEPVLASLAADAGLVSRIRYDKSDPSGIFFSNWVVLAQKEGDLGKLVSNRLWTRITGDDRLRVWTDDYSNIASVIEW